MPAQSFRINARFRLNVADRLVQSGEFALELRVAEPALDKALANLPRLFVARHRTRNVANVWLIRIALDITDLLVSACKLSQ